jgi:hypothetical protein
VGKILTLLKNITRATYALLLITNLCLTKEIGNNNKLKVRNNGAKANLTESKIMLVGNGTRLFPVLTVF